MSLKVGYLLSLGDIEHLDLSTAIPNSDPVIITEGNRTDIVVDLRCLIESGDFRRTARPEIEGGVQGHGNLIFIRPVQQIQVEVVLQIGRIQDFIRFLADLASATIRIVQTCQRMLDRGVSGCRILLWFIEGHDLVIGLEVDIIQDALVEQLLVVGSGGLSAGCLVFDLKGTGADLAGDEAIAPGLRLQILFVF